MISSMFLETEVLVVTYTVLAGLGSMFLKDRLISYQAAHSPLMVETAVEVPPLQDAGPSLDSLQLEALLPMRDPLKPNPAHLGIMSTSVHFQYLWVLLLVLIVWQTKTLFNIIIIICSNMDFMKCDRFQVTLVVLLKGAWKQNMPEHNRPGQGQKLLDQGKDKQVDLVKWRTS